MMTYGILMIQVVYRRATTVEELVQMMDTEWEIQGVGTSGTRDMPEETALAEVGNYSALKPQLKVNVKLGCLSDLPTVNFERKT